MIPNYGTAWYPQCRRCALGLCNKLLRLLGIRRRTVGMDTRTDGRAPPGGPAVAVMRPVYAPALVAFIGGGNWAVSLSMGGPALGWVSLGPGEIYTPAYQVSPAYFRTLNVSNTTAVSTVNITNVYNNVYVNKSVTSVTVTIQRFVNMAAPNAVTAMPENAFASGLPVSQVGMSVPRSEIVRVQTPQVMQVMVAPGVAPMSRALAPMAISRAVARPPASVISRAVVARAAPPARQAFASSVRSPATPAFRSPVASAQPALAQSPRETAAPQQKPPQKAKPRKDKEDQEKEKPKQ